MKLMMISKVKFLWTVVMIVNLLTACKIPQSTPFRSEKITVPESYSRNMDSLNSAGIQWRFFFNDSNLVALIDTALINNQEYQIMMQEISISSNEIRARKGEYLPFIGIGASTSVEKPGRFTRSGAVEEQLEIKPGKKFPDPLNDHLLGMQASWEIDIWKKLRNARQSAVMKYLATREGRNFMVTHLIAEIANAYYELMALDNQLVILRNNIQIQQSALVIVKLQKEAAKTTELAVRKFEAEVLGNQSRQYAIMQRITETENRINFLTGRFPQPVKRNSPGFTDIHPEALHTGIPAQLLVNRPDIRQAEYELAASKLDVKTARANFYPAVRLTAGMGFQAYNPSLLLSTPESFIYSATGDLLAPLINRNAIKAMYYSASAKQLQSIFRYEQTILKAHIEVVNQMSNILNLERSYELKSGQVQALTRSIDISTSLFISARADYMEVLMTQRDALESKFELLETKMQQMNAMVNMYRALGGGWN